MMYRRLVHVLTTSRICRQCSVGYNDEKARNHDEEACDHDEETSYDNEIRPILTNTAAGCNRMHVICTAPAGGTIASMEFNKQFGGGYEAKTVTALLKCNAKQNWIFTKDGVS
ncbi:hypothetical protein OSTOST_22514, partial [Ostertagia ostertagi]